MKIKAILTKLGVQPTPGLVFTALIIWLLPLGTLWLVLFLWLRKSILYLMGRTVIVARIH